jgi:hypothetical protein
MREVRDAKRTDHAFIADVWTARRVNAVLGFGAVTPWQIKEFDEETLAVLHELSEYEKERADQARNKQEFENKLAQVRANHPTYRKR